MISLRSCREPSRLAPLAPRPHHEVNGFIKAGRASLVPGEDLELKAEMCSNSLGPDVLTTGRTLEEEGGVAP